MHQPKYFQEKDTDRISGLVRDNPLGTLTLFIEGRFEINHIPFALDTDSSGICKLRAHIPRANSLSKIATDTQSCVVVFQGPDGYISPSWYATKQEHGKVVPTWNYAVVHVHGEIKTIDDSTWVIQQLQDLTQQHEENRSKQWHVSDAPADFTESQLAVLVGLEINVTMIEAKTKASQNQPAKNRASVLQLLNAEQPDSRLTDMMRGLGGNGNNN